MLERRARYAFPGPDAPATLHHTCGHRGYQALHLTNVLVANTKLIDQANKGARVQNMHGPCMACHEVLRITQVVIMLCTAPGVAEHAASACQAPQALAWQKHLLYSYSTVPTTNYQEPFTKCCAGRNSHWLCMQPPVTSDW